MNNYFISYSRKNSAQVDKIAKYLEDKGYPVWLDREDMKGGDQWRRQIVNNIKNCEAFILILSKGSIASDNVRKEIDLAEQYKKQIIPVTLENVDIPEQIAYQLVGIQRVDLTSINERSLGVLMNTIRKEVDSPTPMKAPAPSHSKTLPKWAHFLLMPLYFAVLSLGIYLAFNLIFLPNFFWFSDYLEFYTPYYLVIGVLTAFVLPATRLNHNWFYKQAGYWFAVNVLLFTVFRFSFKYTYFSGWQDYNVFYHQYISIYFLIAAFFRRRKTS